ncbi:hypothetical protein L593_06305 [Salinarchaeum sp. Harcht-Bsk1]|uniref:ribbon-helix-helix domain-containing protein n=1 Tax=Salinarchaeum sp. Harcht-Bsk1 TaxID=1333523 RepID=UPI0003424375|nr:ribbon-helix-helix domain-containing protein [Salinarchaeum sp. Harcht-Bsk1]AGN01208.1 hypothetical protein L593_06305 [Salinarchaeum sp. Harcht-Bsk1]
MGEESTAYATRVSRERARAIEAAREQMGVTQSEFVERALRYYLEKNPKDIPALRTESKNNRPIGGTDPYDPTQESFGD